ncbi:hypothetical protein J3F83DRAFT_771535 [Trichoderma novae-zelandiae]
MHLIKKSRRMLSGIFHARPASDVAPAKSRSKTSRSRRRRLRRGTSPSGARRTMEMMICRGEKRKREDDDDDEIDDDDAGWGVVQCKKRLVGGGAAQVVAGEQRIAPDDVRSDDMPSPLPLRCEASGAEPGEPPNDYEELLERVHSTLENLAITDAAGVPLDSRTGTRQPSPETHPHTDPDEAWLEGLSEGGDMYRYRARRCHSETSIGIPSSANAVTGRLPDDGGRRSAPPNLDTAWSAPSDLRRRASLWSVSALSGEGTLDGMVDEEAALELVLFAESEAEDDVEVAGAVGGERDVDIRAEEEEARVGTAVVEDADTEAEVEEVSVQAAVAAVAEAMLRETTLQQIEAAVWQADETTLGEPKGEREPESGPSSEQEPEAASTQASEPPSEPASSPTEPISESTFRSKHDSPLNWGLDTTQDGFEPRVCRRQATAEDVAGRIRAVKDRMMESLLDIEQRLRPHCSGARI